MSNLMTELLRIISATAIFHFVFKFILQTWRNIHRSYKTGNYKQLYSAKRTKEYFRKKSELDARYCKDGLGSYSKKTGIFSDDYRHELDILDNEYAVPGSQEYSNIKEREKKYDRGEK